ncbi:hypothetical protein V0U79_07505 [Hyphobacterium sp. HN65]|uniref:Glycosyl transferase family 28 C-terminal domain-containing protein n=1 Tax=Hyphobacterium lacteum TaxID=3116575 RepID=A0ABU7LRJ1_9PROT|nr:hypothetical protein [Hyphobacterium sp. HN65]MEE2526209.1 hypothetical protein [Hyphobacterium sp. HN65]
MIWLRCRLGLEIGTGHAARCFTLTKALEKQGVEVGLVLDEDAGGFIRRVEEEGLHHVVIRPGIPLVKEAARYPDGNIVLDLSNPTIQSGLSDLVAALKADGRKVALIEGLDHEAYPGPASPDLVITPYLGAEARRDHHGTNWIGGGAYAVLGGEYSAPPSDLEARSSILMMMSGSDPWHLTEEVLAVSQPFGEKLVVVIGGSIPPDRARKISKMAEDLGARIEHAPPTLQPLFMQSRAALIGPGLVKYEAVATRTPAVIISPGDQFVATQSAFIDAGLAEVLNSGRPDFAEALSGAIARALTTVPRWPAIIDGQGAGRAAQVISKYLGE